MMIFRSKKDKIQKNQPSDNDSVGSNNSAAEPPYLKKVRKLKLNIDFERMVNLPPLVDENEWLATHGGLKIILMCFIIDNHSVVGLFHSTNNLVEVMTEICTSETCPSMNGPSGIFKGTFIQIINRNC